MTKDKVRSTEEALKKAFKQAFQLGQDYWYQADHEFESQNKKSDVTRAKFEQLMEDAIKEALMSDTDGAQPAVTESHKQEPVAWMDDYNACKCPDNEARCFSDKVFRMMQKHTDSLVKRQEPVAKVCHDLDGHIGWNPNLKQLPNEGTPLYTTTPPVAEPHKRKPLTDEEIILIVAECASSHQHTDIHLARAIEQAHGIKELKEYKK